MEHFLEGSTPLGLLKVKTKEKNCICYSSHLGYNVLLHLLST